MDLKAIFKDYYMCKYIVGFIYILIIILLYSGVFIIQISTITILVFMTYKDILKFVEDKLKKKIP